MVTGYESDQLYTDTIYFKFLQVNSLASKGGHFIIDGVRRMLPEMLTNQFMEEMNWTGQYEKISFQKLQLLTILQSKDLVILFLKE